MSDAKELYPIEPEPEKPAGGAPAPIPTAGLAGGGGAAAAGATPAGKAKIEAPGMLEGFEEDADFDKDPELERHITGGGAAGAGAGEPRPLLPEFVKPGLGEAQHWAIAGGVMLLGAMIATGVNAPNQAVLRVLLELYQVLVHTGTGVVAVYVASRLMDMALGKVELAGARMFTAVAALAFIFSLRLNVTGYGWVDRSLQTVIAVGVYVLIVAATFKLWKRVPLMYVVGMHLLLWLIVEVGMALAAYVGAAPVAAKAAGG